MAVRVVTPVGESPAQTADLFTYSPTITSLSRTSGPLAGGTKVPHQRIFDSDERQVRYNGSQDIHRRVAYPDCGHFSCNAAGQVKDLGGDDRWPGDPSH